MASNDDQHTAPEPAPEPIDQAIAVVGMACRFPGDAVNIDAFWDMIRKGKDAWSPVPPERFNMDGWYHPDPNRPGSCHFKGAHFIKQSIEAFDAPFFSISTAEAVSMDPQQRMLLEVVYEALDSAGAPVTSLSNSATSVFCGSFTRDYEQPCMRDPDTTPPYAATGTGIAILANRVSHAFDFAGTSQTIDTGCSASMIAVHQACKSLLTGESDMGIAAGVGLIFSPNTLVPMANLNILGEDGRCYTFDSRAQGYGRGEGVGVVVLKRLSDAIANNDTIRAVVRATSSNQDGHTQGITLPSKTRQVQNMSGIYRNAGLNIERTAYMECHGTGTQAGDVKEVTAVTEVFCKTRTTENPLIIGSVKTNIGHLEGSAGVAGLIKGILVVERGHIPKHLNFEKPNPRIDFKAMKLRVATDLTPWPVNGLRRASVNSFGFGGTNAHVVVDDAAHFLAEAQLPGQHSSYLFPDDSLRSQDEPSTNSAPIVQLFVFSGHDEAGLNRVLESQAQYLNSDSAKQNGFATNYAYTLLARRTRLNWRTFVVASSAAELGAALMKKETATPTRAALHAPSRIAFVFSGQGAQWPAMGRELLCYPVFRDCISAASTHMSRDLNSPFVLLEELNKDESTSRIHDPEIAQPATTAVQVALVDLLRASGIQPAAVVGHSSGEIAAAYAAGAISREDAWAIAFYRGQSIAQLATVAPELKGGMLAVALSAADARQGIQDAAVAGVDVACVNGPESVTLSGDEAGIVKLHAVFREKGIRAALVKVSTAYHSHHMRAIEPAYSEALKNMGPLSRPDSTTDFYSSVSDYAGRTMKSNELVPDYWVRNLTNPVQFNDAVAAMLKATKPDAVVEVSPHRVWESTLKQIASAAPDQVQPTYVSLLQRQKDASVTAMSALGALWAQGFSVSLDWSLNKPRHLVDVPSYPWDHARRYWSESHLSKANRFRAHGREDIIGAPLENNMPQDLRWRGFFRLQENPWMGDHTMQRKVIYPAGGMIAMAIEAGKQMADPQRILTGFQISNFAIRKPMLIPATTQGLENMFSARADEDVLLEHEASYKFSISSKTDDSPWVLNATGTLQLVYDNEDANIAAEAQRLYHIFSGQCHTRIQPRQFYETLDVIGMTYGPLFQNLTQIDEGDGIAAVTVRVPDTRARMPFNFEFDHIIHPATLDTMIQAVMACSGGENGTRAMLPSTIEHIYVSANPPQGAGSEFKGFARVTKSTPQRAEANVVMFDKTVNKVAVEIQNIQFKAAPLQGDGSFLPANRNLCSEIAWRCDAGATAEVTNRFPTDIKGLLSAAAFKNPALSVLCHHVVGTDEVPDSKIEAEAGRVAVNVLGNLTSDYETPRFSQCVVSGPVADRILALLHDAKGVDGTGTDRIHAATQLPDNETFDVVVHSVDGPRLSKDELLSLTSRVSAGGWLAVTPNEGQVLTVPQQHAVQEAMKSAGFLVKECLTTMSHKCIVAHKPVAQAVSVPRLTLLLPDVPTPSTTPLATALRPRLEELFSATVIETPFSSIASLTEKELHAPIVCLVELDAPLIFGMDEATFAIVHRVLQHAKRMLWLTKGAQNLAMQPQKAAIVGLARTLRSEDEKRKLMVLDLEDSVPISDPFCTQTILCLLGRLLASRLQAPVEDDAEYVLSTFGRVLIPRLMPLTGINRIIENGPEVEPLLTVTQTPLLAKGRAMTVHAESFDRQVHAKQSLNFVDNSADLHKPLQPTEVRIRVTGTNLLPEDLDYDSASTMGSDVWGEVVAVGNAVSHVRPYWAVVARVRGGLTTHVVVDQAKVHRVRLDRADQAVCLTALETAVYALRTSRRISKGDCVLVYGAGSAIGQVAIRLASKLGAVVIAACATDAEIALMRGSFGLDWQQIIDLRQDGASERVHDITFGHGADVVLEPTARYLEHAFACVSECGRVIRVAWAGCPRTSLQMPLKNASFESVDVNLLDPGTPNADRLRHDVRCLLDVDAQLLNVVGVATHNVQNLSASIDGIKANVTAQAQALLIRSPSNLVPTVTHSSAQHAVSADGTYVLVGGMGGLGRQIAEHLEKLGARHMAFLSRSGAASPAAKDLLASLLERRVDARAFAVDICDAVQVASAIDKIHKTMPAIRGAVQCAGVVSDGAYPTMSFQQWQAAAKPKTMGTWNLHRLLPITMDFFVLLSSSSGVMGNRGQANYAAGNAFQDALARCRCLMGLHTVSLDLGLVLGAGMVAENEALLDAMKAAGFLGMRLSDALLLVERAMAHPTNNQARLGMQVVTTVGTGGLVLQNAPADPFWTRSALFRFLNQVDAPAHGIHGKGSGRKARDLQSAVRAVMASTGGATGEDAAAAALDEAAKVVSTALIATVARRKGMEPSDLDPEQALGHYGIDSLDAIFVLGWLTRETGVTMRTVEGITIAQLSRDVARRVIEAVEEEEEEEEEAD